MTAGFYAAAAFNLVGMLWHTRAFTAFPAAALYPGLFGPEGCVAIVLWGLAYAAVAGRWSTTPALCGVFCVEKLFYGVTWLLYWARSPLSVEEHMSQHPEAATLLLVYGAGDFAFAVFFAVAARRGARR